MINNKKGGISGVEMIVSFTLFISFIVFIFAFMNPLNMPASRALLNSLESNVISNATIEMTLKPFAVNNTYLNEKGATCFTIANEFSPDSFFITDDNGKEVEHNDAINVKYEQKFYYIHINKQGIIGKPATFGACEPLQKESGYSLSVSRTEQIFYNKSLQEMKKQYDTNYIKLKTELKMPASSDFSIIVFDSEKKQIISMTKAMPRANIMARETPIELLNSDDEGVTISKGYMRLLVW